MKNFIKAKHLQNLIIKTKIFKLDVFNFLKIIKFCFHNLESKSAFVVYFENENMP